MALPQPKFEPLVPRRRRSTRRTSPFQPVVRQRAQIIEIGSRPERTPEWLRYVNYAKTVLAGVASLATTAALFTYVDVVQTRQVWKNEYNRLEQLRDDERDLKIYGEGVDNAMRETAINRDMVPVTPERVIHVEATPSRSTLRPVIPPAAPTQFPAGY
ncbi:MAG: hypothetical protein AAF974_03870 [Cyanobacteria bacterium P01_E01_bin.34]